ncbi:MAG: hypothetical protein CVV34_03740 [Methanomicrobiales archaeon HGW-Methanomicrobiales-5]|nr:MAG: hypothetical protein CVV34_03740 [Methanomicrobiales archaeon HGW-Methanomicrobiales-5]
MKISLMNHQDAGEPDPSASGVTGTGQKYERKTGIVEHKLPRDAGKFSRYSGCTGTIPAEQVPEEFFLPENSAQIVRNPPGSTPVFQEKTGMKNRIVLSMGILSRDGTLAAERVIYPGALPASYAEASIPRDPATEPEDPGPDPGESSGSLLTPRDERQDRIYIRINHKIERLDQKLKKLEGRVMQKRNGMRKPA